MRPKDGNEDNNSTTSKPESDEATPTPADDDQSQETESAASSETSVTMTDSGITHTIPNNSIVTITRHTTITTGRPPTTSSRSTNTAPATSGTPISASSTVSLSGVLPSSPTANNATATPSGAPGAGSLSTGAIAGIAVGGATLIAITVVLILVLVRRKKRREFETNSIFPQDNNRDEVVEEKHFPNTVSTHTTGTQGSSDPFAAFGGRANQPEDPYRPASGAFEMDGTSAAPVELPAMSASSPGATAPKASRLEPVQEVTPTDPRANLTSVPADDGKPLYVNHWNQYKNMG
ncbi:hypothetical protein TrVFT333_008827 [Trichoderma virens FT-333]|nr:hypothetical protein TrVFT333_008827 [Trichoderma virens FT-333]